MVPSVRVALTLEQCWHRVPGGTARAALDSARAMLDRPDVSLVGVAARHAAPPPAPWVPPVSVRHLPLPRRALYVAWQQLRWPAVERATGPVDVIHATGVVVPPRSAPLVVTVNDLAWVHEPEHFTRWGRATFDRALALTRRDADVVVCPSQATVDDCLAHGFPADRLRLVPYGVDVAAADDAEAAAARRRLGVVDPYVLWVGTVEPRKNLPTLLRAFARLDRPDVQLVLAGPQGWREDLDRLAAPLGNRVRRLGFVDDGDLSALYAGAAVFCLPSLREGFGLPVLEAMARAAPVVTSAGTSTAEVVGDAGVVVDPLDDVALTGALDALLGDRARAEALGRAGQARARGTYAWSDVADRMAAVYHEAAGR